MTTGERLEFYIRSKGFSNLKVFCKEISIVYTSLSHVINNRRSLSMDMITKIGERYPELNFNWLLFGRGPMEQHPENQDGLSDFDFQLIKYLSQDDEVKEKALKILSNKYRESQ